MTQLNSKSTMTRGILRLNVIGMLCFIFLFLSATRSYSQHCSSVTVTGVSTYGCAGTYTLTAYTNSGFARAIYWYTVSSGGSPFYSETYNPAPTFGNSHAESHYTQYFSASTTFYIEASCDDGTRSPRVPIVFTLNSPSTISVSTPASNMNMSAGSTALITATGGTGYSWRYGTQFGNTLGTGNQFTAAKGGTWYVTGTNNCNVYQNASIVLNYQPLSDAGWNQTIDVTNSPYTIYGSGSDPEGQATTYSWTKISGPALTMSNATTSALTISGFAVGTYVFQLTVSDSYSMYTNSTMTLTVVSNANNVSYVQKEDVHIPGQTTTGAVAGLTSANKSVSIGYLDGLGRTSQQLRWQGSPSGNDMIVPIEYDDLGRQKKMFLPISTSTTTGNYHANVTGATSSYTSSEHYAFYNSGLPGVATDVAPYADQTFETSPLERVLQKGSPGSSFQPGVANGFKALSYPDNTSSGDYAVRNWTCTSTGLPTSTGLYPDASIKADMLVNEQGATVITFTNRDGLKLLTKVQTGASTYAETYYVYDALNHLRFIMPPEMINLPAYIDGTTSASATQADVDTWCYQSLYDNIGRLVETKLPGVGPTYSIYDRRDRLVLTQDPNQRANNEWSYTKYDVLNRPAITGIYRPGSTITRPAMQSTIDALSGGQGYQSVSTLYNTSTSYPADIVVSSYSGTSTYIATNSITLSPGFTFTAGVTGPSFSASILSDGNNAQSVFPATNDEPLVKTYYDSYSCEICSDTNYSFVTETGWNGTSNEPFINSSNVRGKVVGSTVKILGTTSTWLPTITYYNRTGQPIQVIGGNHLGGRDRVSTLVDFKGKPLESISTAIGYNSGGVTTVRKRFSYDNGGRIVNVYHKINSQNEVILSSLSYNELGQPVKKRLHSADGGTTYLQSLDFRYSIGGKLTNLNNLPADDANDYFGMELVYDGSVGGNSPRKDGMLSSVKWKQDLTQKQNLYNYSYDNLTRLSGASFKANNAGATPPVTDWSLQTNFFNEDNVTYDLNGNIKTLNRKTEYFGGSSYTADAIDQLTYDYGTKGNQLQFVTESVASANKDLGFKDGGTNVISDPDYLYDANGNLIKDQNKSITAITYYFNNRPKRVTFSDGAYLQHTYDAIGVKLKTEYYDAASILRTTTDYSGGTVLINGEVLQIAHDEGRITAPTLSNLIDNRDAGSTAGYNASGTVSVGTAYISSETYVTAVCNQSTGTPGVFPIRTTKGNTYNGVKAGETYSFRVLGYQSVGSTASLYVKTDLGDLVWAGPAMPVGAGNADWVSTVFTVPAGATSLQVGVLWNGPAVGNTIYINRVALYKMDLEYNYFMSDQVGNTRVVLQTNPATLTFTATMETENQTSETGIFNNVNPSYIVASPGNTTPGGNEMIRLDVNNRIGPSKSIKVYPGDVIDASAYSYFTTVTGYTAGTSALVSAAVATAFGGSQSALGDPGSIFQGVGQTYSAPVGGIAYNNGSSTSPSAYLNYILFDKDYKPISGQSVPISTTPNVSSPLSLPTITALELGYVFIYLSYDNASGGEVYFDDLKITVQESPVIQVNNYYPFGMVSYTWLRAGETSNAYLFQGKELIDKTGWHDFGSRMYYADLGRWLSTDPQNQFSSPYLAMGNIPMMGTDPDGELFGIDDLLFAAVGAILNVVGNLDHIHEIGDFLRYAGAGAAGGLATYYAGPEVGFAIAGSATVLADNYNSDPNDRKNGWDWQSFVNGGMSALGVEDGYEGIKGAAKLASLERKNIFAETFLGKMEIGAKLKMSEKGQEKLLEALNKGVEFTAEGYAHANKDYSGWDALEDFAIGSFSGGITNDFTEGLESRSAKIIGNAAQDLVYNTYAKTIAFITRPESYEIDYGEILNGSLKVGLKTGAKQVGTAGAGLAKAYIFQLRMHALRNQRKKELGDYPPSRNHYF